MLGLTGDGDAITLRGFHLNLASFANTIVTLGRGRREFNAVVISGQRLAQAADHVAVRREVPPWEHCLQSVHCFIDRAQQLWKRLLIHGAWSYSLFDFTYAARASPIPRR